MVGLMVAQMVDLRVAQTVAKKVGSRVDLMAVLMVFPKE
jgi:hypothetical protein